MTTVQTRARQIAEVEGFDVIVTQGGQVVDPTENGVLGAYGYTKALKHTKTVADWKQERFEPQYPGYSCHVLKEDGTKAAGNTALRTVRESYEADD